MRSVTKNIYFCISNILVKYIYADKCGTTNHENLYYQYNKTMCLFI